MRKTEVSINMTSTMSKGIYLDAPNIGALEKEFLERAIDSGYISTIGPFVGEFETRLAAYIGSPCAVSTQSGTAAIHIALYELGIGPGDEVIVPALTFAATVNPVIYIGATPVFVDVSAETWNIDPAEIEKNITERTKAVIPVHLYGNPCDMEGIMMIAGKYNLRVIEDATESLGAKYKGRFTGTFGDAGCFSFNGNKIITTGGGGMVVGNDPDRLGHMKFLVNQARDEANSYYHPEIGFNYRMTNIEAALGLAQLERLEEFLAKKKSFNSIYRDELSSVEFIKFQEEYEGAESSSWLNCVIFENEIALQGLQEKLKENGIPTRSSFMPLTEFPHYRANRKAVLTNSYKIFAKSLCLPGSTLNAEEDISFVCRTLKKLVLL